MSEQREAEILRRAEYIEANGGLRTREVVNLACVDTRWLLDEVSALRAQLASAEAELRAKTESLKVMTARAEMYRGEAAMSPVDLAVDIRKEAEMWMAEASAAKKAGEWMEGERDAALAKLATAEAALKVVTEERAQWKQRHDGVWEQCGQAERQRDEARASLAATTSRAEKAERERSQAVENERAATANMHGAMQDRSDERAAKDKAEADAGALRTIAIAIQGNARHTETATGQAWYEVSLESMWRLFEVVNASSDAGSALLARLKAAEEERDNWQMKYRRDVAKNPGQDGDK